MTPKTAGGALPEDASFETLYDRLAEVTAALEAGDLPLEQAIALYEEGMTLAQRCQQLLATVEQRVERLREAFDVSEASGR
jgi:exodeoxyribonuclease VII small subunit